MLSPHVTFNGQCREAFQFYAQLFGGVTGTMLSWADSPMADQVPENRRGEILHASLRLGDRELCGADVAPEQYVRSEGILIILEPADPATAERWFSALAEGGTVEMPLQETFWAARFGVLRDRFGVPWEINCGKAH